MRIKRLITMIYLLSVASSVISIQQATAQTRLGLHVTQEELNIWKQRAVSGPYKEQWDTIKSRADAYVSSPDARWNGRTSGGCWVNDGTDPAGTPGRTRDRGMRDAGLYYLLTGNTNYLNAVRTQLLAQATIAGTNFATNTTVWCTNGWFENKDFELAIWLEKMLLAYDYIRSALSSAEQSTIDSWFLGAANYFDITIQNGNLKHRFANRLKDDYTCTGGTGYCPGPNRGPTHFGGPTVYNFHEGWNNVIDTGINVITDVGIMQNNSTLKNSAKRYFMEWLKYGVFPRGIIQEQKRWADTGVPQTGYLYEGTALGTIIRIADHFARVGDMSLYTMTTEEGMFGSEAPGNPKSLLQVMQHYAGLTNGTIIEYASTTSTNDPAKLIDRTGIENYINFINLAPANLYFNDPAVKTAYTTPLPGSWFNGGYDSLGGDWGNYSMVLAMFGQMEGFVNPYGGPISPTPTLILAASPTSVNSGEASSLTWTATNVSSCSAGGGWTGTKATTGSETVTPTATTTYTLTCSASGVNVSQSATVKVTSTSLTGSLANSITVIATSNNFAVDHPVEHLWDGCLDGISSCTSGNGAATSFWIEFDLQKLNNLSSARLFGDSDGNWVSNSWTLLYKSASTDPWINAFANSNALGNQWFSRDLGNVQARYVRIEVNGSSVGTQAREIEIYGTETIAPPLAPGVLSVSVGN